MPCASALARRTGTSFPSCFSHRQHCRESGPDDIFPGLIEACAWCEALANESGDTVDMEILLTRAQRRHLDVVDDNRKEKSPVLDCSSEVLDRVAAGGICVAQDSSGSNRNSMRAGYFSGSSPIRLPTREQRAGSNGT
jgi:hypothetical protein